MDVTTLILTYNNEATIEKCLESVIGQKGNFSHNIVLWDNASQDNTVVIASHILKSHSIEYEIIVAEKNEFISGSGYVLKAIERCSGDLISFIDGDDLWISELKLQIQFEFLQNHQEVALISSRAEVVDSMTAELLYVWPEIEQCGLKNLSDLVKENIIVNSSVMCRRTAISFHNPNLREFYKSQRIKDLPLWLTSIRDGLFYVDSLVTTRYQLNKKTSAFLNRSDEQYLVERIKINLLAVETSTLDTVKNAFLAECIKRLKDYIDKGGKVARS